MNKNEATSHILCDYEATVYFTFHHLGHYSVEPNDCLLALCLKCGIVGGREDDQKGMYNRSQDTCIAWPSVAHYLFFHSGCAMKYQTQMHFRFEFFKKVWYFYYTKFLVSVK